MVEWSALANIAIWGIVLGAGLPALYALGVRTLQGPGAVDVDNRPAWWRRVIGYACFGVVVAAIVLGIAFIAVGGR